ncbi:putative bifunctional diguanylate cyclase/phosphodiesterase [Paenibacillus sp. y28]|uniref:putative bifunctional diguanylate cyclase/phosphodiesterase n=1 Tax=Paenibacillus sp. y28 TaxID=3129110 RepID=UPI0030159AEE
MLTSVWIAVANLVPALLFSYFAAELYTRNPRGLEYRIAAVSMIVLSFSFASRYMRFLSDIGPEFLQYWSAPILLLSLGQINHVFRLVVHWNRGQEDRMLLLACYWPLLVWPFVVMFMQTWLLNGLYFILAVYCLFSCCVSYRLWRKRAWNKGIRFFITLFLIVSAVRLTAVAVELLAGHQLGLDMPISVILYGQLLLAVVIRYVLMSHDFSPPHVRRYEIVSSTTDQCIWEWDADTGIVHWNDAIHSLLKAPGGYSRMPPALFFEMVHPEDREALKEWTRAILKETGPRGIPFRIQNFEGEYIWVMSSGKAVYKPDGRPMYVLGWLINIHDQKQAEQKIDRLAYYDSLTDLPNRLQLQERLNSLLMEAGKLNTRPAVLLIDLDRFKLINDTLGHEAGDRALKMMAGLMKHVVGGEGVLGRAGGDEFVVLLQDVADDYDRIIELANAILAVFGIQIEVEGHEFFMSASIGISIYPKDGLTAGQLLKSAEIAMYRAKNRGGHQYEMYRCGMDELLQQRVQLEKHLRGAMGCEEFIVHYQPQVDIMTNRIVGMEALIRWSSPDMGLISPVQFIPVAEEIGLIVPIGNWILREACRATRRWNDGRTSPLTISVNVSARQFMQPDFHDTVKRILEETQLPPEQLCLEITESTAVNNIGFTRFMLQQLISLGVKTSVDDFGTGYSSLSQLKMLPLHTIKVDRSFIHPMTEEEENASIVRAIIAMSHSLNKRVVAEGVETPEQLRLLQQQGCDMYQGFLCSRPLPESDMEELLAAEAAELRRAL